jgi:CheY-like chemotaxis protein
MMLDEIRVRQILFNLVGNAIKFTDAGFVKISVKTSNSNNQKSNYRNLVLIVQDSGIGIAKESQQKIFNAFEQQDNHTTKHYGGTGLGLSITSRLVEIMNGTISLKSSTVASKNKTTGSRFTIHLFDVKISDFNQVQATENEFNYRSIVFDPATILVVDDIELNRNLITEFLEHTNVKVVTAVNGKEAIDFLHIYKPDAILMDIRMPVLDGVSATKKIRVLNDFKNIPIIALTASALISDREKIMKSGFNAFISKPIQLANLYIELANFLPHQFIEPEEEAKVLILNDIKLSNQKIVENIDYLKNKILPELYELTKIFIIDDIEVFTQNFSKFLESVEIFEFEPFIIELKESIESFNLSRIKSILKNLISYIENLKLE